MIKNILRLLAAVMALCLLCGCNGVSNTSKNNDADNKTGVLEDVIASTQREEMYEYLFDTVIPEQGLAKLEKISWIISGIPDGVDSNLGFLKDEGYWGVISAVVRDFDMDGSQDMVVFRLDGVPQNQIWHPIYSSASDMLSYVISVDFYAMYNGSITLCDSYPHLMTLDGQSWGFITVALEQMEDGIYIQAWSEAEDYSTYGATPNSVFHIEDGKFVFDYLSGIRYGQSVYSEDPNEVLGTSNLKPREYSLFSFNLNCREVDPAGDPRENRYVLHLLVTLDSFSDGKISYCGTDYTGLRIIAEEGISAFPHTPLPQGGRLPEDTSLKQYESIGQDFIDFIEKESGCEIVDSFCARSDSDSTVTFTWKTEEKTSITLTLNEDGSMHYIGLGSPEWKNLDDFISVKDTILDYPKLGLDKEETGIFKGEVHSEYLNGYDVSGARMSMGIVASTMFCILFT